LFSVSCALPVVVLVVTGASIHCCSKCYDV